jgi:predicted lysophospholipase L1 biosynthesis ABC-type transport system permease subunit
MSETAFPVNDLLRRKLQTSLTLISLTVCIASTLFLLLFSDQIGFGITSVAANTLTVGIWAIFSNFLLFIGILIFAVGAVIVSFITFLIMVQRTRDFGVIKAVGCPNSLVFGYFFTELLIVLFLGCVLGLALGFLTDYAVINMGAFQAFQKVPNIWYAPVVFAVFFVFGLIFGLKPLEAAARLSPTATISPVQARALTLMILMTQPVVTSFIILSIAGWLFAAMFGIYLLSLWPAVRFARKPILEIMSSG